MSTARLEQLQQFYRDEPHDPFNIYALALEYLKHDIAKSAECFAKLLAEHPDYLPTYYHAAQLYAELHEKDQAIRIFEKGIALAKQKNDYKAMRELQSAYDELVYE